MSLEELDQRSKAVEADVACPSSEGLFGHCRDNGLPRAVATPGLGEEFYTELRYFVTQVADKPRSFSIRERDYPESEFAAVPSITFCSAALPTKFEFSSSVVVRHHHRYPSFGSRRR